MFYNAKSASVKIENTEMYYVTFGKGEKPFVILPGLSDGLSTVHKKHIMLANYYKIFAKDFKVYVFSRKNDIPKGYSTKEMADDLSIAMKKLGIETAHLMGISQGGMIAQHFAINHPDMVDKLVLGVTIAKANDTITKVIGNWIKMAENEDMKSFTADSLEKTYTERTAKKYRPIYPIITKMNTPKSYERFLIQAHACITHNAYDELDKITCDTLVIGGNCDKVVGKNTSNEIAEKIKGSKLVLYDGYGHGVYEENKEFNKEVLEFIVNNS